MSQTVTYTQVQKLVPDVRAAGDGFVISTAVDGLWAVTGWPFHDFNAVGGDGTASAGAVFVYQRNQRQYVQRQKIVSPHRHQYALFGYNVSVYGDTMAISATGDNLDADGSNSLTAAGAVYIYTLSGGTWSFQQKIVALDGTSDDRILSGNFGNSIDLGQDMIAISSMAYDTDNGAVWIYTRSGSTWSFYQKIRGVVVETGDNHSFGRCVSLDTDAGRLWVTSNPEPGFPRQVFIFDDSTSGFTTNAIIDGSSTTGWGATISGKGDRFVTGAVNDDFSNRGAVYLHSKDYGGTNNWGLFQKFLRPSPDLNDVSFFGSCVGFDGVRIFGGDFFAARDSTGGSAPNDSGAIYVYQDVDGNGGFAFEGRIHHQSDQSNDYLSKYSNGLNQQITFTDEAILVPAPGQDFDEDEADFLSDAGAVYVFLTELAIGVSGGVKVGGSASVVGSTSIMASGGVVAGGTSANRYTHDGTGGVVVAGTGSDSILKTETTSGGVVVGGSADVALIGHNIEMFGGVLTSGFSYNQSYIPATGGVVVAGAALNQSFIVAQGGVVAGGNAIQTFYDYVDGTGGAVVGGNAIRRDLRIYNYTSNGNLIKIGGTAGGGITGVNLAASGGVSMSGSAGLRFSFNKDLTCLWNLRAAIFKDLTFLWNLGELPAFWYRIIGKGRQGDECNLVADPCCQKFIVNIHARTLGELCEKLSQRRLNLPIESVQRFSRPAENSVVQQLEAEGDNFDCNELTPVEICGIPKCSEFCIDEDLTVTFGFTINRVQIDAFLEAEAEGGVFIAGSAICSYAATPYPEEDIGGGAVVGGEAFVESSYYAYTGTGGLTVAGTGGLSASAYSFIGGEWPSIVANRFSLAQESLADETSDQVWSLVERIAKDDNLYASTDISYAKKSEFLIARNFNLDIPETVDVLGAIVNIERWATQSGVRDLEVYLLVGDEIISDNLADTTNDWPVGASFSPKSYGSNGYDGSGQAWSAFIDPADLNDPNFGIAIRIESQLSLAAIIANVDYISLDVFYEEAEHQRIRMGGEAKVVSSAFSYVGSGEIEVGGEAGYESSMVAYEVMTGGVTVSGGAPYTFNVDTTGGVVVGAEALVDPIWAEGGAVMGGEAKVTPFFEEGTGGAVAGGGSLDSWHKHYEASGGVTMGGTSFTPEAAFTYEATGGVSMAGSADRRASVWSYTSDGNAIFILGSAGQSASDYGTLIENAEFDMTIRDIIVAYGNDQHLGDAEILNTDVAQCGCFTIPLMINFEHNLVRDNILAQFLVRNNLSFNSRLLLSYNTINNSWQRNVHFKGLSADANTYETWDIVIELQCTNIIGSTAIGRDIWKLSMQFFRENLDTGEDYDSRIILGILPEAICDTNANELKFTVTYDTQADVAVVNPNATIYQNSIYDNIGLFKRRSWINNPDMVLTVSQVGLDSPLLRVDVTDEVLIS